MKKQNYGYQRKMKKFGKNPEKTVNKHDKKM